jgi:hypothetical protein
VEHIDDDEFECEGLHIHCADWLLPNDNYHSLDFHEAHNSRYTSGSLVCFVNNVDNYGPHCGRSFVNDYLTENNVDFVDLDIVDVEGDMNIGVEHIDHNMSHEDHIRVHVVDSYLNDNHNQNVVDMNDEDMDKDMVGKESSHLSPFYFR